MEPTKQQKEALCKDITELTEELKNGDLQHLDELLTEAGVDAHKLFYYCAGDNMEIGLVLGKDGLIYYFEHSEDYDDESPDDEPEDNFNLQKVSITELIKDKKIYPRGLVALEMGGTGELMWIFL